MANFSYSEDTQLKELNERVKQDPDEFENWEKLITRAGEQEGGVNRNSSESAIAGVREVYDLFLARFPLFHGYWKRYADLEFTIAGSEAAVLIYERGVASVSTSVDLWASYCGFKNEISHNFEETRELFNRGADCVGLDFLAHPFWDKFIEFEERIVDSPGDFFKILGRIIHIPLHQYARYFERYRNLAITRPVQELAPEAVIKQFSAEISQDNVAQPKNETEVERELRLKIDGYHMEIFKQTQVETTKRWTYEQEIKRPYYHLTELDEAQLANWRRYLDFEEAEGNYERTKFLHERCLETAANYDEFWFRYARWQMANGKNEEVRNIYQRASCIFVDIARPEIRLAYAAFEESLNRVDVAVDIHEAILSHLKDDVGTIISLVNVHRRQYGLDTAVQVLDSYLADPSFSVNIRGQLMVEKARFSSLDSDAGETRKLYQKSNDQYLESYHFWSSWLLFELRQSKNAGNAKILFEQIRQKAHLPPEAIRELAAAYMVYLKEQGGKDAMKEYIELDQDFNGTNVHLGMKRKLEDNDTAMQVSKRHVSENGYNGMGVSGMPYTGLHA